MSKLTFDVIDEAFVFGDGDAGTPVIPPEQQTGHYYIDGTQTSPHEYVINHDTGTTDLDVTIKDDNGSLIYAPVYDITDSTLTVYLNPVVACTVYWETI